MVHVDRAIIRYVRRAGRGHARGPRTSGSGSPPAGALAWIRAAKTWALTEGRGHVVPEDVATLARPVLGHRLLMASGAAFGGVTPDEVDRRPAGAGARCPAIARERLRRALAPLRMLTPLGRGVVRPGDRRQRPWPRGSNWQEFTQLGDVALRPARARGWSGRCARASPTADLVLRPTAWSRAAHRATVTVDFQAGAGTHAVPQGHPPDRSSVACRCGCRSCRPTPATRETVPLPALPRGVYVVGPVTYEKTDPVGLVSRRFASGSPDRAARRTAGDGPVGLRGRTHPRPRRRHQPPALDERPGLPRAAGVRPGRRPAARALEVVGQGRRATRPAVPRDPPRPRHGAGRRARVRRTHGRRDFELAVSVATSIALRAVRDDFDTYLRCGPHVARGRAAEAMTDAACRFDARGR